MKKTENTLKKADFVALESRGNNKKRIDNPYLLVGCDEVTSSNGLFDNQADCKLRGSLIIAFRWVRWLALCFAVAASGATAFAKSSALNPAQLGTFCPPGSELADAKHTNILSTQEQGQIKKLVQGFMALDADARRFGNPKGASAYWEKGYTNVFNDTKDVPVDGLEYIAFRIQNICADKGRAVAVLLLDVAEIVNGTLPQVWADRGGFLSSQSFWDAFSKKPFLLAKPYKDSIPEQPMIFTVLPLFKDGDGRWLIDQGKVPGLTKFRKAAWQSRIDSTDLFAQCSAANKTSQYNPDRCMRMARDKVKLLRLSRPAWSIYPKDIKPGIAAH